LKLEEFIKLLTKEIEDKEEKYKKTREKLYNAFINDI